VAQILRHASGDSIPSTERFRELGMDSLTSMELRNRLQSTLDCQLAAGVVFNYPTMDALATYLAQNVLLVPGPNDTISPVDQKMQAPDSPRVQKPPLLPTPPLPIHERKLAVGGLALNVCEWGADNECAIVCLHGIMDHGASWETVAGVLVTNGRRVIAPDLRGHGHSSHVGPNGCYQLRDFVGDLNWILRKLDTASITLVGHSLGSMIAALYATARPSNVHRLVLVEPILPPARGDSQTFADQIAAHLRYLDTSCPVGAMRRHAVMADLNTAAERLRQVILSMPEEMALKMAERLTQRQEGGFVWRWDARLDTHHELLLDGLAREEYLSMLARIQAPITVVYGTSSGWLTSKEKDLIQTALPDMQPVVLNGGHSLHIEASVELAKVILQIIDGKIISQIDSTQADKGKESR
jgi:pimeloyl-ACP methyl ester carboxylesterase